MFDYLFEWIQNLAFYLVIMTAVFQVIPGNGYKKYIRFFSGLVLILLMITPVLKLTGIEKEFTQLYHSRAYDMEQAEIKKQQEYFEGMDILNFLPKEYIISAAEQSKDQDTDRSSNVEVEEIQIGE